MTQDDITIIEEPSAIATFNATDAMLLSLRQTKPWVRFISIIGFLVVLLLIAAGILSFVSSSHPVEDTMLTSATALLNIVMAALYLLPSLFLFKYASAIKRLLQTEDATAMEAALQNQKSFWKFMGILTLVMLIIALLGIVAAIIFPSLT